MLSEQKLKELESGLTDNTVSGKCSGCGSCCASMLPVTKEEIDRLSERAKRVKPHNMRENPGNTTIDFTCPFLIGNKCSIYDDRPLICRSYICSMYSRDASEHVKAFSDHLSDSDMKNFMSAKHYNLWNLFGKTGIRSEHGELLLKDMPELELHMDDGSVQTVLMGTYVELPDRTGDIVKGLLAGIDRRGLHVLTPYRELVIIPC